MLTKDHVGHIAAMHFVDLHGDASTIVPHSNGATLGVDVDLHQVLRLIVLVVVGRVHQDLV